MNGFVEYATFADLLHCIQVAAPLFMFCFSVLMENGFGRWCLSLFVNDRMGVVIGINASLNRMFHLFAMWC